MLKATLAERLGRVTAADAYRSEMDEFHWIDYPRRRVGLADEAPVERALRRVGVTACSSIARTLPEPMRGAWCGTHWRETGGTLSVPRRCDPWPRAEHTLVTAPLVRAMRHESVGCLQ